MRTEDAEQIWETAAPRVSTRSSKFSRNTNLEGPRTEAENVLRTTDKNHAEESEAGTNGELESIGLKAFERANHELFQGELGSPITFDWRYGGNHAVAKVHDVSPRPGETISARYEYRIPLHRLAADHPEAFCFELLLAMLSQSVQSPPGRNGKAEKRAGAAGYKPKAYWNKAVAMGLAGPRSGATGKITSAKLELRLQESGKADRFIRWLIAKPEFQLPVFVAEQNDPPNRKTGMTRQEAHKASKTTFYCPKCLRRGWGVPSSGFDCRYCSPPHPDNVHMVPVTAERFTARRTARVGTRPASDGAQA